MVKKRSAQKQETGSASADPHLLFNGHPHRVARANFEQEEGATHIRITIADVATKHEQMLAVSWEVCKAFIQGSDLTDSVVRLNGHDHTVVGARSKLRAGTEWFQIGVKDATTGHISALEVRSDLLAWRTYVLGVLETAETALKFGGSLPARLQRAIDAFLEDPQRTKGDRDG